MSLLKREYIENRIYQENIHLELFSSENIKDNILVVAPTSAGKTINELFATDYYLSTKQSATVVILAPTNILCAQHRKTFVKYLELDEKYIQIITGETSLSKRVSIWKNTRLAIATPNCFINDLLAEIILIENIALVVFDEVHMTRKDHTYNRVAKELHKIHIRIIGFTASLGDSFEKQEEIIKNINAKQIIFLDKDDPSYAKYYKGSQQSIFLTDINNAIIELIEIIDVALYPIIKYLTRLGHFTPNRTYTRKEILIFIQIFREQKKFANSWRKQFYNNYIKDLYYYLLLTYIKDCIVTGTYYEAYKFIYEIQNTNEFPKILFRRDNTIAVINIKLEKMLLNKIFHPKVELLEKRFSRISKNETVIIFVNNHYTAYYLKQFLIKRMKLTADYVLGQNFMPLKKQIEIVRNFDEKIFNILIASSIAEAGIHIPSVKRIIHFNPPINGVSLIQRSGRTGRTEFGLIDFIIANHPTELIRYYTSISGRKRQRQLISKSSNKNVKHKNPENLSFNFLNMPLKPKGIKKSKKKIRYKDPKQLTLF